MSDVGDMLAKYGGTVAALVAGAFAGAAGVVTRKERAAEEAPRSTGLPPPPTSGPVTLSNADLDALRSRMAVLEGQNADQGRRIAALEAADAQERRETLAAEARKAMTVAANAMTDALNRASGAKPRPKEAPRDPRRDSDG